ncbi:hypothetical protein Prudu_017947 [Prunus dulcis]|uniref:Uncharacterized protein n=1 Tax=Prunus dulcis TaxID=3755 RepID=A0A4Y1RPY5_PRUDU|nr:hypothetical protein Prudu_017947 [Prunus dulcis]
MVSLPSTARLYQVAKTTSQSIITPKHTRSASPNPEIGQKSKRPRLKEMETESSSKKEINHRLPLSEVVSDCIKRWFKDTLKEAKAGDINMQVLVGQMYYNGYGVPRDAHMNMDYKKEEYGLQERQGRDLQFGKSVISSQNLGL